MRYKKEHCTLFRDTRYHITTYKIHFTKLNLGINWNVFETTGFNEIERASIY